MRLPGIGAALVVFLCTLAGAQNTLTVPSPYTTIQQAINSASNGDTVLVSPGAYFEDIDFVGKAINVTSTNGALATTIQGTGSQSVVKFVTSETALSILDGFTITGGSGTSLAPIPIRAGGGILIRNASPVIQNCLIIGNTVNTGTTHQSHGGGIHIFGAGTALIQYNTIQNNFVGAPGASSISAGGGIGTSGSSATIRGNIIQGNTAQSADLGGGIWVSGGNVLIDGNTITGNMCFNRGAGIYVTGGNTQIRNNTISNNNATQGGGGGGIFAASVTSLEVVNNQIIANFGGSLGGGGMYITGGTPNIVNNLFAENIGQGNNFAGDGAGIFNYAGTPNILGCTFVNNTCAAAGGNGGGIKNVQATATTNVRNCIFFNNTAPPATLNDFGGTGHTVNYCFLGASQAMGGTGNIDGLMGTLLPQFVNPVAGPGSDYHIMVGSPCQDVGDTAATGYPTMDIDGEPRIMNETIDMGSDELASSTGCATGNTNVGPGPAYDALVINGSAGGTGRFVYVPQGVGGAVLAINAPPANPGSANYILWFKLGYATTSTVYTDPFGIGNWCFTPQHLNPADPTVFTLANSFGADPLALFPLPPAPTAFPLPPLPPIVLTLQGLMLDLSRPPSFLSVTNALTLLVF